MHPVDKQSRSQGPAARGSRQGVTSGTSPRMPVQGQAAAEILTLQHAVGNRAVSFLLASATNTATPVGGNGLSVQRLFTIASAKGKSHLREQGQWRTHKGPHILKGDRLLVDFDNGQQVRGKGANWRPALNVGPDQPSLLADDRRGYIRKSKVKASADPPFGTYLEQRISRILRSAETEPWLRNRLDTQDHVDFLMDKSIRSTQWIPGPIDTFAAAFQTLDAKLARIKEGADYVAKVLIHWKEWLYPEDADAVVLESMRLVKSDLHERGLGVLEVRFRKPKGGTNTQYSGQTKIHAFIKPEDKSLEQNLLGHGPNSAASKINKIAGLKGKERIRTIKMESTPGDDYGTFVEAARGVKTEDYFKGDEAHAEQGAMAQSFHETLIFAYLAGIDDLHSKNVYFEKAGRRAKVGVPTLIDADVVMGWSQMNKGERESSGGIAQTGFSGYNRDEAEKNQQAITAGDNSEINSKILNVMLTNPRKRRQVIRALKDAISGHKGRVVPVRTQQWGQRLKFYVTADNVSRNALLTEFAAPAGLVRKGKPFESTIGPGLYGTAGESLDNPLYNGDVEKAETKTDLDMGSIPFYEYEYTTGRVTHNGQHIYNGVTLEQAMGEMLRRFGG